MCYIEHIHAHFDANSALFGLSWSNSKQIYLDIILILFNWAYSPESILRIAASMSFHLLWLLKCYYAIINTAKKKKKKSHFDVKFEMMVPSFFLCGNCKPRTTSVKYYTRRIWMQSHIISLLEDFFLKKMGSILRMHNNSNVQSGKDVKWNDEMKSCGKMHFRNSVCEHEIQEELNTVQREIPEQ